MKNIMRQYIYFNMIYLSIFIPQLTKNFNIIISILLPFILLYFIYIFSNLLHLLLVKVFINIPIYYWVLYPITKHRFIKIQPIRLLYYPESYIDIMFINIILENKDVEKTLLKSRIFKEISLTFSIILFLFLYSIYVVNIPLISYVIVLVFSILISFTGKGTIFSGNRAMLLHKNHLEITLSKHYITEIPIQIYENYLKQNMDCSNFILYFSVFENYINKIVYEDIDLDFIKVMMIKFYELKYRLGISVFIRLVYINYRIGLIGLKIKSDELVQISRDFCQKCLLEEVMLADSEMRFKEFLKILETGDITSDLFTKSLLPKLF